MTIIKNYFRLILFNFEAEFKHAQRPQLNIILKLRRYILALHIKIIIEWTILLILKIIAHDQTHCMPLLLLTSLGSTSSRTGAKIRNLSDLIV